VKRSPLFIESMTRVRIVGYTIRIWRKEESVEPEYNNDDLKHAVYDHSLSEGMVELVKKLCHMDRVTAVEILPDTGIGFIHYMEW
jgi:hypothetical protein